MRPADHSAPFVLVRLLGAAVALTGGSLAGLVVSETWCAPTAAGEARYALFAGAAALVGVVTSMLAWRPRTALRVLAVGALLALAAAPLVSWLAAQREGTRAAATREALLTLGGAVERSRSAGGPLPDRPLDAERLAPLLDAGDELPVHDGWGGAIRYEPRDGGYALVARCRCGLPDEVEGHSHVGPAVVGPRADMVFANGALEPWPGGPAGGGD